MMNIRTATKRDVFEYAQMVKQFRSEYPGKITDISGSFKQVVLDDIKRGACRIVEVDNKIVGYVDLMFLLDKKTNKVSDAYILNLFIKPEYRRQGIARNVRKELIKNKTISGTVISYERARHLAEYFNELGYQYVRPFPEYDFGGQDQNLCLLLTATHPRDSMTTDLTSEKVGWCQALAQVIAEKIMLGEMADLQQVQLKK